MLPFAVILAAMVLIFYFFRTGQGDIRLTALFPVVPAAWRVNRLWNIFRHCETFSLQSISDIGS